MCERNFLRRIIPYTFSLAVHIGAPSIFVKFPSLARLVFSSSKSRILPTLQLRALFEIANDSSLFRMPASINRMVS